MIYYKGTKEIKLSDTVIALGKFDGLHKGHQLLFDRLKSFRDDGLTTVVFTFDFHPLSLLTGHMQELIYTREERRRIIEELGIDVLIEYPFTQETAHMPAEDFVRDVLVRDLGVRAIVVGDDFHFGYQRKGDVALLTKMSGAYGYSVIHCEKLCHNGQEISATQIREQIGEGNLEAANLLLGRPYSITGEVIHGKGNGSGALNMPTANIAPESVKLLPPEGVYVSSVQLGEKSYGAVTNIGHNPTVGDHNDLRVETFIMDFFGNLYGQELTVDLYRRLRGEIRFDGFESLKKQMHADCEQARSWLISEKII